MYEGVSGLTDMAKDICDHNPKFVEAVAKVAPTVIGNVTSVTLGPGAGAIASTAATSVAAVAPNLLAEATVAVATGLVCEAAAGVAACAIVVASPLILTYALVKGVCALAGC
jgi:hypothetical protein